MNDTDFQPDQYAVLVRNLTFHYPDGRVALTDVSFKVQRGESIAIIGPNGAGKSTLLLHLNGILPGRRRYLHTHDVSVPVHEHDETPRVWIHGLPVTEENLPEIRQIVGLLFQDPDDQLFCPTVLEDVAFGPRNLGLGDTEAVRIARECLAAVGLRDYEARIPHHLSFGERKRVCLAGVLACRPRVIALDEPTSNLDPRSRRQFIGLLRDLDCTKIVATHDLELVLELCNRAIVLDQGQVFADGPVEEILSDAELMESHGLEVPLSLRLKTALYEGRETATRASGE